MLHTRVESLACFQEQGWPDGAWHIHLGLRQCFVFGIIVRPDRYLFILCVQLSIRKIFKIFYLTVDRNVFKYCCMQLMRLVAIHRGDALWPAVCKDRVASATLSWQVRFASTEEAKMLNLRRQVETGTGNRDRCWALRCNMSQHTVIPRGFLLCIV